jgi:type IV secretion system protein VirD4
MDTQLQDLLSEIRQALPRGAVNPRSGLASAHWEDPMKVIEQAHYDIHSDMDSDRCMLLLGRYGEHMIGTDSDQMHCLCANARGNKGVSVIIPALLIYRGSMLVFDFKAELSRITARRRTEMGHKVVVLDASGRAAPHVRPHLSSLNPLSMLVGSARLIEDAALVADSLVLRASDETDPYWSNNAVMWIHTLILHMCTYPAYDGRRSLVTLRELLTGGVELTVDGETFTGMRGLEVEMRANLALGGLIRRQAIAFADIPERTRGGIVSCAQTATAFLDFPSIQEVTRDPEDPAKAFDFRELKTNETGITIYLSMDISQMATCMGWVRCLLGLCLSLLEREEHKPPIMPMLLMDEVAALGHSRPLELYAGFSIGVKLFMVIQSIAQLKEHYKSNWHVFLSGIFQCFSCSDEESLSFVERRLGKTSVLVTSTSTGMGTSIQTGENQRDPVHGLVTDGIAGALVARYRDTGASQSQGQSINQGTSTAWQVTELLHGAEFATLCGRYSPLRLQLIINPGDPPIVAQRNIYYEDPEFLGMYDE